MPLLVQVCIVIMTIGLLTSAFFALRILSRFLDRVASDLSQLTVTVRESASRIDEVTLEARDVVASVRDCVSPLRRVVDRFEVMGQRTADLSSTLLSELELPVFAAAAVARGVRSGTGHLLGRLLHRLTHRSTLKNGGSNHE